MEDRRKRRDPAGEALDLIDSIRRNLRLLVIATVFLYAVMIAGGAYVYTQASEIHDSLCTFRNDLDVRIAQSQQFLNEHPKGISGIGPEVLQQSIDNYTRTRDALDGLSCPPPVEVPPL